MNQGHLRIVTTDRAYNFPTSDSHHPVNEHDSLRAELKVINPSFWIRLALMSDLGFAEVRRLANFNSWAQWPYSAEREEVINLLTIG